MTTARDLDIRARLREKDKAAPKRTPRPRAEEEEPVRRRHNDGKSDNPQAIRKRMRRKSDQLEEEYQLLAEVTERQFKPLEEWDLEELANGRPRNAQGSFVGPKPRWMTAKIREEVQRRLREETLLQFDRQAGTAVRVLADFLGNDTEPRLRFEAAKLILEYVIGKPEQKVSLSGAVQLQNMLANALVLPGGEEAHPVVDSVLVEDAEDPDEDEDL